MSTSTPLSVSVATAVYSAITHPAIAKLMRSLAGHQLTIGDVRVSRGGPPVPRDRTVRIADVQVQESTSYVGIKIVESSGASWSIESGVRTRGRTTEQAPRTAVTVTLELICLTTSHDGITEMRIIGVPTGATAAAKQCIREIDLPRDAASAGRRPIAGTAPKGPAGQLTQQYQRLRRTLRADDVAESRINAIVWQVERGDASAPELSAHLTIITCIRDLQARVAGKPTPTRSRTRARRPREEVAAVLNHVPENDPAATEIEPHDGDELREQRAEPES